MASGVHFGHPSPNREAPNQVTVTKEALAIEEHSLRQPDPVPLASGKALCGWDKGPIQGKLKSVGFPYRHNTEPTSPHVGSIQACACVSLVNVVAGGLQEGGVAVGCAVKHAARGGGGTGGGMGVSEGLCKRLCSGWRIECADEPGVCSGVCYLGYCVGLCLPS